MRPRCTQQMIFTQIQTHYNEKETTQESVFMSNTYFSVCFDTFNSKLSAAIVKAS